MSDTEPPAIPPHPLEGYGYGSPHRFYLGGVVPALIHAAHVSRLDADVPGGKAPHIMFHAVIDGRILDPRSTRNKPIMKAGYMVSLAADGVLGAVRQWDDVRSQVAYARARDGRVASGHCAPGSWNRGVLDLVVKAAADREPAFLAALADTLSGRAADLDREVSELEASAARTRTRSDASPENSRETCLLHHQEDRLDLRRTELADCLTGESAVRRLHERLGGVPSDLAQRAAQNAARAMDERREAALRSREAAVAAEARREVREQAATAVQARRARLDARGEAMLELLRSASDPDAPGPGPGSPEWLRRAAEIVAAVDGIPAPEATLEAGSGSGSIHP